MFLKKVNPTVSNHSSSICNDIFDDPVVAPACEHNFCKECIESWLTGNLSCPLDRKPLEKADLRPAQRILRVFLSKLRLRCSFDKCGMNIGYDHIKDHEKNCKFAPHQLFTCQNCHTVEAIGDHKYIFR